MYPSIIKNKTLPNILVFGGTGYVGGNLVKRMINKFSLNEQYNIIVLSSKQREVKHENIFKNVYLFNGINCFDAETYRDLLPHDAKNQKCKYIIHSIGIFNTNLAYKKLLNNKSICQIPSVLSGYVYSIAKNAFDKEDTDAKLHTAKEFYKWNYQSLENVVENVSNPKTKLIYISANKSSLTSKEYIDSKRLAEKLLLSKTKEKCVDGIVFRPGILYDNRLKNLHIWEVIKLLFEHKNQLSLRDLINYLISNNLVINRQSYFTNIDSLDDKICESIIETANKEVAEESRIVKKSDI